MLVEARISSSYILGSLYCAIPFIFIIFAQMYKISLTLWNFAKYTHVTLLKVLATIYTVWSSFCEIFSACIGFLSSHEYIFYFACDHYGTWVEKNLLFILCGCVAFRFLLTVLDSKDTLLTFQPMSRPIASLWVEEEITPTSYTIVLMCFVSGKNRYKIEGEQLSAIAWYHFIVHNYTYLQYISFSNISKPTQQTSPIFL